MMNTKKILAGIAAAALLFSLTACGNAGQTASQAPAQSAADTTAADSAADSAAESAADTAAATEAAATGELEKTTFEIGHLNSTAHLLIFVAKEEGYFDEEGLNANLTLFSSAGELATGLESGKLDVALIGSVPTITFQSQGHDLTVFGGAMSNGHGYVIKKEFKPHDTAVPCLKRLSVPAVHCPESQGR